MNPVHFGIKTAFNTQSGFNGFPNIKPADLFDLQPIFCNKQSSKINQEPNNKGQQIDKEHLNNEMPTIKSAALGPKIRASKKLVTTIDSASSKKTLLGVDSLSNTDNEIEADQSNNEEPTIKMVGFSNKSPVTRKPASKKASKEIAPATTQLALTENLSSKSLLSSKDGIEYLFNKNGRR